MSLHRSKIYFVELNPAIGKEQRGKRPVLILSIDNINQLPLVVTVVVGTKGTNISRDYPTNVRVSPEESNLPVETVFYVFRFALWMQVAFQINQPDNFQNKKCRKSNWLSITI